MSNTEAQRQKIIFAKNLNHYMKISNITQSDIVDNLNLTASTVSDWCNAKKYPRVDKIQLLADYFGILKSDLTEEKGIAEHNISLNNKNSHLKKSNFFVLDKNEKKLIDNYRLLPEKGKRYVLQAAEMAINTYTMPREIVARGAKGTNGTYKKSKREIT